MTIPLPPENPRDRLVSTAHGLFARHGVDGTSMRMVADESGLSKAAVFYHFGTKRELVEATAALELAGLEVAVERAEQARTDDARRRILLDYAIDRAVQRRRETINLQNDPAMARVIAEQGHLRELAGRFQRLLFDLDDADGRIDAAIVNAVISQTVHDPLVADLDDDDLRAELVRVVRMVLR